MEQVYVRYPEDREAAVFYGLALNASALPTDRATPISARRRRSSTRLGERPNHPGVVHYLIHSDNSPEFAQAGLDAAICYSKIAPDVPHALHHALAHIRSARDVAAIDRTSTAPLMPRRWPMSKRHFGPESFDTETVHTMDYLEYAYLQTAG